VRREEDGWHLSRDVNPLLFEQLRTPAVQSFSNPNAVMTPIAISDPPAINSHFP
jgi:hypothetical protein